MTRKIVAIIVFLLFATGGTAWAGPRYGLWVEAEGKNKPFESVKNYQEMLEFTGKANFTDLYCQVYRGGRSWYPSLIADDQPYRDAVNQGFDPLADLLKLATKRKQRVHAWVNVLRVKHNRNAPILKVIGSDAVLMDSYGSSMLDYDDEGIPPAGYGKSYALGTPGIWLDASNARVRQYLVETVRDVALHYPELAGIHLDMIRYPETMKRSGPLPRAGFGYSRAALQRFYEFTGRSSPVITPGLVEKLHRSKAWQTWKRAQVTLVVFEIREMLKKVAPQMELSAAVMASPDRSYGDVYQDWGTWTRAGLLDSVLPMAYNTDTATVSRHSNYAFSSAVNKRQVIVGLGAWMMVNNPNLLIRQGKNALESGAGGVSLFSYSNLLSAKGVNLVKDFERSVFPKPK